MQNQPISRTGVENVKLGACEVWFGGQKLGLTKGGVEVELSTETYTVKLDQFGETSLSERITGRNVMVKVPMAETDIEKMAMIIPGSTLNTVKDPDGDKDSLEISVGLGLDLHAQAKELTLVPIGENDYAVTVHRAATNGSMSFAYKHNEERVFSLEFNAYPDASQQLMTVGEVEGLTLNEPPTANAGANITILSSNLVVLDGSRSTDPNEGDAARLSYQWSFYKVPPLSALTDADITDANTVAPSFTPDALGEYSVRLVVSDGFSESIWDQTVVKVTNDTSGNNTALPIASAGLDRTVTAIGQYHELTAVGSKLAQGSSNTLEYQWQVLNVPQGQDAWQLFFSGEDKETAKFWVTSSTRKGDYEFKLTVTDGDLTAEDTVVITLA